MKKGISIFLAIAGVASLLLWFPASTQSGAPEAPAVLRMVHYIEPLNEGKPYDVGVGKLIARFTEETGIEIELITRPWDQIDRDLVVSNKAGMPNGDIYAASSQRLSYLVKNDALMPLDDMLDVSFDRAVFLPQVLAAGTYPADGALYLMLQSVHTRGLWYNTDYIEKPPETLEELVTVSEQVMREHPGIYGFAFWGGMHYGSVELSIAPLAWAQGGILANADGSAAWDNEAVKKAIQFYADCVHTYGISPAECLSTRDYVDIQSAFHEGSLAMIMDGDYSLHRFRFNQENDFRFAFTSFPGPDGPTPNFSNGWAWGIPKHAQQPDLAWQFISWFQQASVQEEHARMEGSLPTRVALADAMAEESELFHAFQQNFIQTGRSMDAFVYYQEAMEELTVAASSYCFDTTLDLDALLEDAQRDFNDKYY